MTESIGRVEWTEFTEAIPAFVTLVATPLTFSIATGLSLGLISFTLVKVAAGKFREVSAVIWILTALFIFATFILPRDNGWGTNRMKNRWVILVASLCGAVIGVVIVRYGVHMTSSLPAFALDRAALEHGRYLVAAIPWILFSLYWEIAAKGAAEAKSSESRSSRAFHVFLANVAVLLVIAPIRGLGRFLPASFLSMAAGIVVEVPGLFLAIWARRALGRNWSGEISIKFEHELIRSWTVPMAEASYLHGIAGNVCGRRAHYW